MARGPGGYRNTSGLRPWRRGQSGNPRGRPRESFSQRSIKQGYRNEVVLFGSYLLMQSNMKELEQIAKDETRPAYQVMMAKALLKAVKNGNVYTLNTLLNHIVGKPQDSYE